MVAGLRAAAADIGSSINSNRSIDIALVRVRHSVDTHRRVRYISNAERKVSKETRQKNHASAETLFRRELARELTREFAALPWRLPITWCTRRFCCDRANELARDPVGTFDSWWP